MGVHETSCFISNGSKRHCYHTGRVNDRDASIPQAEDDSHHGTSIALPTEEFPMTQKMHSSPSTLALKTASFPLP